MIEKKILDGLKEIGYELKKQGKNGFELYIETKKGSGDVCFVYPLAKGKFHCAYRIKDNNGEIIEERGGEFEKKNAAQDYLVRICCGPIYSKLEVNNEN